jgi:hypothetical protein
MSKSNNAIAEIKNLMVQFGFLKADEAKLVEENFLEAKLKDGTVVKVEGESLAEGAKVVVVTEEGEIPAPNGVHELEDGSKIETVDGLVKSIQAAVAAEEELPGQELPGVQMPKDGEDVKDVKVTEMGYMMPEEMVNMLKDFIVKCSEKIAEMEAKSQKMEAEFNAFKKEPAAKKIATAKSEFNAENKSDDDLEARVSNIIALRNKNKK